MAETGKDVSGMETAFEEPVRNRLDTVLLEVMKKYDVPGAVAGVWVRDKGVWLRALGEADIASGRPINPVDSVRIASITKTFTATTILLLCDEELIALEETLDGYFDWVPGADHISIRELCNNTSGLFDYLEDQAFLQQIIDDPLKTWSPRDLVEVGISREPYFPPGEDYHYSNTNFVILGMLIEEVTGNHLEYEIKRRILDKLGLNRTLFPRNPEMTGDYSHGYWEAGPKGSLEDITEFHPSLAWAAGAMTSNLMDLRLWALALGTGALLSDYAFEQQRRWVDASSEGVTFARYGLGLIAMGDFVGHEGQLLGFNTAMYYHPVLATTVIVLLNKFFGSPSVAGEMFLLLSKTVHPDITFG